MAVDVGSAVGYLDLDISGFLTNLKTAQAEAQNATKSMSTTIGDNLTATGRKMTAAGSTLTKSVTVPVVGLGTAVVKAGMTFESAMSKVAAVSGATGDELGLLNEKAQELGLGTSYSASQVAEGMTEMAKAGWNSQQIIDGMAGVLNAATASGESLASVSTIVADAITGFGMEAKDATKVADLLTEAANAGTIDINDLGESFKYVAPLASTMGFSIEDTTTALSAMSTAGIKGSQAGTSLRTVFSRLTKPTAAVQGAMDELNISIANQDGTFKSLDQILSEMRGSFSNMTDEQKAYYATVLAGQEGQSGLLAMLNMTQEEYDAIAESMDNCSGVAEETSKIMMDNFKGQITQLTSALEGLGIQFSEVLFPYLKRFVSWLQDIVKKLQGMSQAEKDHIVRMAAFAAAIGPILLIGGKLLTGIGTFITTIGKIPGAINSVKGAFTKLTTWYTNVGEAIALTKAGMPGMAAQASKLGLIFGSITAPIAIAIGLVVGLIAVFTTLWKTNEHFRDKVTEIWGGLLDKLKKAGQKITDALNELGFNFTDIVDVIKSVWEGFCNLFAPLFIGVIDTIATALGGIIDVVTGVIQIICGIIKGFKDGDWSLFLDGLGTLFEGFLGLLTAPFQGVFEGFKYILETFGTTWESVWDGIVNFFKGIWDGIKGFFKGIWDGIVNIVYEAWEGIKTAVEFGLLLIQSVISAYIEIITLPFRMIWENCKGIVLEAWNAISDAITNAFNYIKDTVIIPALTAIQSVFSTVWNAISSFVSTILGTIYATVTNIISAIRDFIINSWNTIKANIESVMNAIKSVVQNVWNAIRSVVTGVIGTIKSSISSGLNSAKNTVSGVLNAIKGAFTSTFNGIKSFVSGIVNWLKGIFNFNWSLPKIKLPHFKISGSFSLNPPQVPSFGIEWYKKAMNTGMFLNSPTLFGFDPKTGKFLGGGEAGSETIVGTQSLMQMITQAVSGSLSAIADNISGTTSGDIIIPVYVGNEMLDTLVVKAIDRNNYRSGGR